MRPSYTPFLLSLTAALTAAAPAAAHAASPGQDKCEVIIRQSQSAIPGILAGLLFGNQNNTKQQERCTYEKHTPHMQHSNPDDQPAKARSSTPQPGQRKQVITP